MLQYLHEVLHHGAELVPVLDTGWPALVQPLLPAAGRDVPDVPPLPGSTRHLHSPHTGEVEICAFWCISHYISHLVHFSQQKCP